MSKRKMILGKMMKKREREREKVGIIQSVIMREKQQVIDDCQSESG